MDSIFKTGQAILLDQNLNIINKVPVEKLPEMVNTKFYAIVMDGILTRELYEVLQKTGCEYVVCIEAVQKGEKPKVYTIKDLEKVQ